MSAAAVAAELARLSPEAYSDADITRKRQEVLAAGYAVTSEGIIPGVSSVAAPVFTSVDSLPLAITVVFPAEEVDKAEMDRVTAALLETTRTISRELGASTDKAS
jgi:DNA-binding IclR family transcriptional regulator